MKKIVKFLLPILMISSICVGCVGSNKSVNDKKLNWDPMYNGAVMAKDAYIPTGFEFDLTTDTFIQLSRDPYTYKSYFTEDEMNNLILTNYVPNNTKVINHKQYLDKSTSSNRSNRHISEYTLKSNYKNLKFKVEYIYNYSKDGLLHKDYEYVTLTKI